VKLQDGGAVEGDIFHRSLSIDDNSLFEESSRRVENPTDARSVDSKSPRDEDMQSSALAPYLQRVEQSASSEWSESLQAGKSNVISSTAHVRQILIRASKRYRGSLPFTRFLEVKVPRDESPRYFTLTALALASFDVTSGVEAQQQPAQQTAPK
jgi:hypothetical protein